MERWLQRFVLRCRSLFRASHVEAELDEELRFHLDQKIEQLVASGMSHEQARRTAVIGFGGIDQQKEACRDARRVAWFENALRDARHALQLMVKRPGPSSTVVLT